MMHTTLKSAFIIFLFMDMTCTRTIRLGSHRWVGNSGKPFIRLARNEQREGKLVRDQRSNFGYPNVDANHQVMALGSSNHRMTPRKPYFSWSMAPFANNYFQDAIWRLMEDRAFADGKQDQNQIRLTR